MNQQEQRPDPRKLLEAFVTSSRSEKAFTSLVACLSGLVYSSALRRTGNAQLAEEVAQNVFAIMARKASSLLGHPSLEAWTLETTRLEAAAMMRSEKRRQRKLGWQSGPFPAARRHHRTVGDERAQPGPSIGGKLGPGNPRPVPEGEHAAGVAQSGSMTQ